MARSPSMSVLRTRVSSLSIVVCGHHSAGFGPLLGSPQMIDHGGNGMLRAVVAFTCASLLLSTAASAQDAEPFRGKSVTLYIGTGAGGGYDTYGRLVARHLGRMLPGNPNIV